MAPLEIFAFAFGHEWEQVLHSLLGVGGSEDTIVQRLVRTPTGDWKLMVAPAVCEYVLASPNIRIEDTMWNIEKMRITLLPSIVGTSMLLELLDVDIKEGLVAGAKTVFSKGGCEGLSAPRSAPFVRAPV